MAEPSYDAAREIAREKVFDRDHSLPSVSESVDGLNLLVTFTVKVLKSECSLAKECKDTGGGK
jgi:hypothetical protein